MMKKLLVLLLTLALLLCGCNEEKPDGQSGTAATVDFASTDSEMFTDRDLNPDYSGAVAVKLSGDSAQTEAAGVSVSAGTVTVTAAGSYVFSGELTGSIIVNAGEKDKVQLVLSGAQITNEAGAAICVLQADKVFVTLAEGTENSLTSGESMAAIGDYQPDAALCSRSDLTINGSGSLKVTAPGGHGISGKDDLAITGGYYSITCSGHGLDANNSLRIREGNFTVESGKDGLHAEHNEDAALGFVYISAGVFEIHAQGDGISAGSHLQLHGGTGNILAGGGHENGQQHDSGGYGDFPGGGMGGAGGPGHRPRSSDTAAEEESTSMKGIKAGAGMLINGGSMTIDSADDALHSDTVLVINGGSFAISSGDDAVHAEEKLSITNAEVDIFTCYEGLEALEIYVSGGDIKLKATDDGLNAAGGNDASGEGGRDEMFGGGGRPGAPGGKGGNSNGIVEISGGTLYVNASGDGIDANGSFRMSGGNVTVVGPTVGDTATLDYDTSATITGGVFIGTGGGGMAQTFSDAEQGVFSCSVGGDVAAGTRITLTDAKGNVLFDYTPEQSFAVVILSSPELKAGEEYTITAGNVSGTLEAE